MAALIEEEAELQVFKSSAEATGERLTVLLCSCVSSWVVTFITQSNPFTGEYTHSCFLQMLQP